MKDRTCSYQACRFYHLKGTKIINKKKETLKQNFQSQNYKSKIRVVDKTRYSKSTKIPSSKNFTIPKNKNRFSALQNDTDDESENENESNSKKQVFRKTDPALAVTLQEIMSKLEVMNKWQKDHQNQTCNTGNSSQANWRASPKRELVSMTQEQKLRWESQDRALSQSSY
jgi:hypothetical protein